MRGERARAFGDGWRTACQATEMKGKLERICKVGTRLPKRAQKPQCGVGRVSSRGRTVVEAALPLSSRSLYGAAKLQPEREDEGSTVSRSDLRAGR